jgi:4'-phosphopantetheinyl transferase
MSLLYRENRDALSFGIWHMTETEAELENLSGCTAPTRLSNPSRKCEYLAIRALAVSMGLNPGKIDYLPSGKPFLKEDSRTISLSHTKKYAALLVADHPLVGIDIEQRTERVVRVRHKFMHPTEEEALVAAGLDTNTGLLMHWCAKEAVFKAVPEENIDFAREIRIIRAPVLATLSESTGTDTLQVLTADDSPTQRSQQQAGEVRFLRTGIDFQLEGWSTEAFVMVICHSLATSF